LTDLPLFSKTDNPRGVALRRVQSTADRENSAETRSNDGHATVPPSGWKRPVDFDVYEEVPIGVTV
jgi:hypothetical protein